MAFSLRPFAPGDAAALRDIYGYYVQNTLVTWEYETGQPSGDPCVVAEDNGEIIGYAYANPFRHAAGYKYDVESTIYLRHGIQKRAGLGRALYGQLFAELKKRGIANVYACIWTPNPESENFHRAMGFEFIGTFKKSGFKFGAWHDMAWFGLGI